MTISREHQSGIQIAEYESRNFDTDKIEGGNELTLILFGLFGEVGSLMAVSKKNHREKSVYAAYTHAVVEELGDTLWYFTALCRRLGYKLKEIFDEASKGDDVLLELVTNSTPGAPIAHTRSFPNNRSLDDLLLDLGREAAALIEYCKNSEQQRSRLIEFARIYLMTVNVCEVSFTEVAWFNLDKSNSRFVESKQCELADFDVEFPKEEQLPRNFEFVITERPSGKSHLQWNGVFIGAPLADNINDQDGYRFHDVFHLAHAAILHWSPTFRALIHHKRKSDPKLDDNQDGGRAIVIEEGLTAYIFSYAKDLDFFEGQNSVSFDLLKTIKKFVRGYEVEKCPLWLWERAILEGYTVFRQLSANRGGKVIGDRNSRTIKYECH